MSDEPTFTIGEEEFDGHRLYGPAHGEDLSIEEGGGSGTVPWKVRFRDIQRLSDAIFPIAALQGDSYVYSDAMPHPYFSGLVAVRLRLTPYSPAEDEDDGDYRWAIATIEFAPPKAGDKGDDDKPTGELAGWKEQWKGAVQLVEKDYLHIPDEGGTKTQRKRIDPYPLINLSITSPPFPKQPISRIKPLLSKVNSAVFTTPSGVQIAINELLYGTFSADVSVIRMAGKSVAAWTLTNDLLWRPITGWLKDYNENGSLVNGALKLDDIKKLDGTTPIYLGTDLMALYKNT